MLMDGEIFESFLQESETSSGTDGGHGGLEAPAHDVGGTLES